MSGNASLVLLLAYSHGLLLPLALHASCMGAARCVLRAAIPGHKRPAYIVHGTGRLIWIAKIACGLHDTTTRIEGRDMGVYFTGRQGRREKIVLHVRSRNSSHESLQFELLPLLLIVPRLSTRDLYDISLPRLPFTCIIHHQEKEQKARASSIGLSAISHLSHRPAVRAAPLQTLPVEKPYRPTSFVWICHDFV